MTVNMVANGANRVATPEFALPHATRSRHLEDALRAGEHKLVRARGTQKAKAGSAGVFLKQAGVSALRQLVKPHETITL